MLIVPSRRDAEGLATALGHSILEGDDLLPHRLHAHGCAVIAVGVPELTGHQRQIWSWMVQARGGMTVGMEVEGVPPLLHAKDYPKSLAQARAYERAFPRRPGIGALDPDIVLVGETPNPNTLDVTQGVPFAAGPAGEWLCRALAEAPNRCLRGRVYVTNAVKHDDGERMVAREIRWLRPTAVVALGNIAHAALSRLRIHHSTATHPQHARRFHYHEPYALELHEAINHAMEGR